MIRWAVERENVPRLDSVSSRDELINPAYESDRIWEKESEKGRERGTRLRLLREKKNYASEESFSCLRG